MLLKNHRLIGIIRIESPVPDITGGDDDDSTIGGVLAGFAQRSLLAKAACLSRVSERVSGRSRPSRINTATLIRANLERLTNELEQEFAGLSEVLV